MYQQQFPCTFARTDFVDLEGVNDITWILTELTHKPFSLANLGKQNKPNLTLGCSLAVCITVMQTSISVNDPLNKTQPQHEYRTLLYIQE